MVNVAIAGGTSPTLGKSITEAILATGKHKVVILTRESTDSTPTQTSTSTHTAHKSKYGASLVPVDYTSVDFLTTTLDSHRIHTLISLLKPTAPGESLKIHERLLEACQSARVSRFILSDFSLAPPSHSRVDLLAHKTYLHKLGQEHMSVPATRSTHVVECCTIQNGGFMEYFVQGCPSPDVQAGLQDGLMLKYIDIAKRRLVVPCVKPGVPAHISMTSLIDIGKYIAASLDLPPGSLTGQLGLASETFQFTKVVDILASMDPPIVVKPVYTTRQECEERAEQYGHEMDVKLKETGEFDVELLMARIASQMVGCLCGEEEGGGAVTGKTWNEMCPEVESVKLEDLLRRGWGGKKSL